MRLTPIKLRGMSVEIQWERKGEVEAALRQQLNARLADWGSSVRVGALDLGAVPPEVTLSAVHDAPAFLLDAADDSADCWQLVAGVSLETTTAHVELAADVDLLPALPGAATMPVRVVVTGARVRCDVLVAAVRGVFWVSVRPRGDGVFALDADVRTLVGCDVELNPPRVDAFVQAAIAAQIDRRLRYPSYVCLGALPL
jgi:hypothetical protein